MCEVDLIWNVMNVQHQQTHSDPPPPVDAPSRSVRGGEVKDSSSFWSDGFSGCRRCHWKLIFTSSGLRFLSGENARRRCHLRTLELAAIPQADGAGFSRSEENDFHPKKLHQCSSNVITNCWWRRRLCSSVRSSTVVTVSHSATALVSVQLQLTPRSEELRPKLNQSLENPQD